MICESRPAETERDFFRASAVSAKRQVADKPRHFRAAIIDAFDAARDSS